MTQNESLYEIAVGGDDACEGRGTYADKALDEELQEPGEHGDEKRVDERNAIQMRSVMKRMDIRPATAPTVSRIGGRAELGATSQPCSAWMPRVAHSRSSTRSRSYVLRISLPNVPSCRCMEPNATQLVHS